jgi:hypothetical protein
MNRNFIRPGVMAVTQTQDNLTEEDLEQTQRRGVEARRLQHRIQHIATHRSPSVRPGVRRYLKISRRIYLKISYRSL